MPPPNTPEEGLASSMARLVLQSPHHDDRPGDHLDLEPFDYEGNVDENLLCPICQLAMVSPHVTACDHTFCKNCIIAAHTFNPFCPIDRRPLQLNQLRPATKLITNQLDNLTVRCTNRSRGCDMTMPRSMLENHVSRYCEKTLVPCPHPSCDETIVRKDADKGCLHYDVKCTYCNAVLQKAKLEVHQDRECPKRTMECAMCGAECVRHRQAEHFEQCPETRVACTYATFGCDETAKRRLIRFHEAECPYRVVGPVGNVVVDLQNKINVLMAQDRLKERRIKFLEDRDADYSESGLDSTPAAGPAVGLPGTPPALEDVPFDSRDQYFLSLFEIIEGRVGNLNTMLGELDSRFAMMLFNESRQAKDQLAELRNNVGVLSMHVRWLMQFRLQERNKIFGSSQGTSDQREPPARL